MSFLFPAMLSGLASLALPVVLHLIARQRFPVLDFPTIRLLTGERRTNTLAPRLVDVWQLLLRLLVLTLLILAMSRLFAPWISSRPATHNTVIVIDGSSGMTQLVDRPGGGGKISIFDLAKERAAAILRDVIAPSRASVVVAGGAMTVVSPLEPGHEQALANLEKVHVYDASGSGLVEAVARACDMLRGRREVASEVIVLTDMRRSSFEFRSQRDVQRIADAHADLAKSLNILFVDLAPKATENLGITRSFVRGRTVMVGADAHVISTIANTGTEEKTTKVQLSVGGRKEPVAKSVKISPGASAVVDLTSRVNRATRTFAHVSIDEDTYAADDSFDAPLPVVDSRRVLIVNGQGTAAEAAGPSLENPLPGPAGAPNKSTGSKEPDIDGATILRFVLNPGRELGGTSNSGIDPVMVTPEAVAAQPLSKYEIVVLYDVSGLSEQVMGDLATFVSEGKSLLIICSGKTSAASFNRSLATAAGTRAALAPAELGNDITLETPAEIALKDNSHPVVSPFADPRRGDLSVIRFQKIRGVQRLPEGSNVILQTAAQQPLALERAVGRGRVIMLTFGLEMDRGNIARTRVFPPFIWRVVDYLTGQLKTLPPDQLVARTPAAIDVSESNFSLTSDLELVAASPSTQPVSGDQPLVLPASADRTVFVDGLPPGQYLLEKARSPGEKGQIVSYARGVTVQADPAESDMSRVNPQDITQLFGERSRIVTGDLPTDLVPHGGELWKLFVICLVIAYATEAVAGYIATSRREKLRGPETGVAA